MTHALVGLGLGRVFTARKMPLLYWGLCAALPMVPDLDVVAFPLGIPYGDPLGHRGFSHSLVFAALLGFGAAALCWRRLGFGLWELGNLFFLIAASHGILDAMTNGGSGVAFFWPWSRARYFLPWRPVQVSPIGLGFFSEEGTRVLVSEALWVCLPATVVVGLMELGRFFVRHRRPRM